MPYTPGTHVIAALSVSHQPLLIQHSAFKTAVNQWIEDYQLNKLGEVYHDFEPGGFTAVVCLSESHLSVHTWPEFGRVNLDIYLSNHQRNNDGTVKALYQSFIQWFGGEILQEQFIQR